MQSAGPPLPNANRVRDVTPPGQLSVALVLPLKVSVMRPGEGPPPGRTYEPVSVWPPRKVVMSPVNVLPAMGPLALNQVARPSVS